MCLQQMVDHWYSGECEQWKRRVTFINDLQCLTYFIKLEYTFTPHHTSFKHQYTASSITLLRKILPILILKKAKV
ncbi:hypothetical protein GDO81_016742 [Engystomops pustulosus]|uniref:Uncharacterized protein n=1 Tax=Engystomops pustulosus TaxID=76066 RepID=A0AAV7AD62_ENGPU|nr:hypothetical protein GDO81_016742 [Engystomops pustulosus]